jgi:hypothetical protein
LHYLCKFSLMELLALLNLVNVSFYVSVEFLCTDILLIIRYFILCLTSLIGKIDIFPYKRAQRCADSVRTFKAGKEAGETIKLLPNLPLLFVCPFLQNLNASYFSFKSMCYFLSSPEIIMLSWSFYMMSWSFWMI